MSGADLLAEIVACQSRDNVVSDKLARMLILFVDRYATKSSWNGYSYNDEMKAEALMHLCCGNGIPPILKFDPSYAERASIEKGIKIAPNAFGWTTQLVKHSFVRVLNQHKKERDLRDDLLISMDCMPSFSRQVDEELKWREVTDDVWVPPPPKPVKQKPVKKLKEVPIKVEPPARVEKRPTGRPRKTVVA